MLKPRPGDLVTATCGTRGLTGIVVRLEGGAFWVETTDGQALRFELLPASADESVPQTSH